MSKNQTLIKVDLQNQNLPVVTIEYKGKFLCKSPARLAIKTLLSNKPKRKDKTYDERMSSWKAELENAIKNQIVKDFIDTLYGDEINKDVRLLIN